MIKTIAFDLGGVIMTITNDEPVRRFEELGVADARQLLDPYTQTGFFGDLEEGKITDEEFRQQLSAYTGNELSWQQCQYGWMGYVVGVPLRGLKALEELKARGYRLVLVSNTNGFIQAWANSPEFSEAGLPLTHYFDYMYRSSEMGVMKPAAGFFEYILEHEQTPAEEILFVDDSERNCAAAAAMGFQTFQPVNGEDWTEALRLKIKE
jgi:putative hydrolase of the HAD superfamily